MNTQITKLGRERLLMLADKLVGEGPYTEAGPVPVGRFDLDQFVVGGSPTECGFVACAVGWAYVDPWFRRRGIVAALPMCGDYPDWDSFAVAEFFAITVEDADDLFFSRSYRSQNPGPTTVAKRIRDLVAGGEVMSGRKDGGPATAKVINLHAARKEREQRQTDHLVYVASQAFDANPELLLDIRAMIAQREKSDG